MDQIATDIGSRLRQAREQRGLTLRDIATTTKISMTALNAIEHNDFSRLPGGVFRRAYLRAFAAEVGLNGDELAREYRARYETEPPADPLSPHEADWKHRLRLSRQFPAVLVSIVGILISGALIVERGHVPDEASEGPGTLDVAQKPLPGDTTPTDDSDGTEGVALAHAAVADGRASLRLDIRTRGPCWVSAVADGERVVYRLMQPGDHALVEARATIRLRVGDAGTVVYSINGAAGRPLGRDGDVVTVHFTNDNLESWYAEPASPESPKGAATRISRGPDRHWQAGGSRAEAS
jgi:cytoskeletal protein RodZ